MGRMRVKRRRRRERATWPGIRRNGPPARHHDRRHAECLHTPDSRTLSAWSHFLFPETALPKHLLLSTALQYKPPRRSGFLVEKRGPTIKLPWVVQFVNLSLVAE